MGIISLTPCSNIEQFRGALNGLSKMSSQAVNVYLRNNTELEYKVIAAANQRIRPVFHSATKAAISNFILTNRSFISSLKAEEVQALKKLPGVRTEDRPSNIVEKFAQSNLSDLSSFLLLAIEMKDGELLADFGDILEKAMDRASYEQKASFFHQLLAIEPINVYGLAVMDMCRYSGMGKDMKLPEEIHVAADQGNSEAQFKLGYCYQYGLGVTQNEQNALQLFRLSAEQGHSYGQLSLGNCYEYAWGVPQDLKEAGSLYRRSVAQGLEIAKNALARLVI